jgi:hypothetical protein
MKNNCNKYIIYKFLKYAYDDIHHSEIKHIFISEFTQNITFIK